MNFHFQCVDDSRRRWGPRLIGIAVLVALNTIQPQAHAQQAAGAKAGDKIIVESGEAAPVAEKVRAAAPGTLVCVFVKPGDAVRKNQILGHTELAPTKYQLDLALHALENMSPVAAAEGHAEAWTATREETEHAVRRRMVEEVRLEWARGMEKFHRANHDVQLEQKKLQRIQYEYCKQQYEARFMRSPVDGVVTQVLSEPGKAVGYATHVFTVSNGESYMIPVSVSAELTKRLLDNMMLPIRSTHSQIVTQGRVDGIADDPSSPGRKTVRVLINQDDLPQGPDSNPTGMTFDVLLPQDAT